ncbi:tetratricopeptide repeat protein 12-like [Battus philenor]|uniref:tetratricopeptide repeat protein 12-like n=1 Tax=Battus philenor TaxID=42288 RepID=UPI0035D0183F
MAAKKSLSKSTFKSTKQIELNEEWNNFMKRIGEVSNIVKDLASGDKAKSEAASVLADQYLEGKIIKDDDIEMKIKEDRTVINRKAFECVERNAAGEMCKEAWMAEVSKDAELRAEDRKIRREKMDTLNTQAIKAFRRGDYDKALSCYNRAIEYIRDNHMLYCDRALTNIKLGNYEKVLNDCDLALRLNEKSFKARLYKTKAYKELEDIDKFEECKLEVEEMFPQHNELIAFFLRKEDIIEDEN